MVNSFLANIIQSIDFDTINESFRNFDLSFYSKKINLYNYQQEALKASLIGLWQYYAQDSGEKIKLYEKYIQNGLQRERFDVSDNKKESFQYKLYSEYYEFQKGTISFENFVNRMSFWMATGSGKTLIIIKLIELLNSLKSSGSIPNNDILFLTARDDLIEQFKKHINRYNSDRTEGKINLINLKEYENEKFNKLSFSNEIKVFYYRADNLSMEQKDVLVDFRNYDNDGKWYLILDEAHKGGADESKRKSYFNILSRNGFLFNFSATFTDDLDFATNAFRYNLEDFTTNGYGKQIYISQEDLSAFNSNNSDDFTEREKKVIMCKALLLLTYEKIMFEEIKAINPEMYHEPLLMVLVNSVNTEDSDLEMFFKLLLDFLQGKFDSTIFRDAKNELQNEFTANDKYFFDSGDIIKLDLNIFRSIDIKKVIQVVFKSDGFSNTEVLIGSSNKELAFQLINSTQKYALIKIGEVAKWINEKLNSYTPTKTLDTESFFSNLDNSEISILMGSRSFYEGWDSNRPNIILFVNIGKRSESKKFVQQAVGRGVRIEPVNGQRKRLIKLRNNNDVTTELFNKIGDYPRIAMESLFVFGTKASIMKDIFEAFKDEKTTPLSMELELNPDVKGKELLIPTFKDKSFNLDDIQNFRISEDVHSRLKYFISTTDDKVLLLNYAEDYSDIINAKRKLNEDRFVIESKDYDYSNIEYVTKKLFTHIKVSDKEVNSIRELNDDDIVHFKRIKVLLKEKEYNDLKKKIQNVINSKGEDNKDYLIELLRDRKISEEQFKMEFNSETNESFTYDGTALDIKYLKEHYYVPLILSDSEKVSYINHIIKHTSEVDFINKLNSITNKINNKYDWWMFSKLDETVDSINIPYFDTGINKWREFNPDFIFWLCKGKDYKILFVDPKGTTHASYINKVEGFRKFFKGKDFSYKNYKITADLKLVGNITLVQGYYKNYWLDVNQIEKLF